MEMKVLNKPFPPYILIEEKNFRKTLWKKVKLLKMSNFTFFHNVFYAVCILRSLNSHISVVVCSFFEFGTVLKWCIRQRVKDKLFIVAQNDKVCPCNSRIQSWTSKGKNEAGQILFFSNNDLLDCLVKWL